jgi:hypothetical protein
VVVADDVVSIGIKTGILPSVGFVDVEHDAHVDFFAGHAKEPYAPQLFCVGVGRGMSRCHVHCLLKMVKGMRHNEVSKRLAPRSAYALQIVFHLHPHFVLCLGFRK